MPSELLLAANTQNESILKDTVIDEVSIIETLKTEDNVNTIDKINSYKEKISKENATIEEKNSAFDAIKLLNQISSQEELLEEKIKISYNLDSFIKIEDDQIRVVIDSDDHTSGIANQIMRTIQENFETKKYISVNFK